MSGDVNGSRDPRSAVRGSIAEDRGKRILAEVDRELPAALSIAPSADFEARVLRRVAEDDATPRWQYGWLAAAAVMVAAAGLFFAFDRPPSAIDDAASPRMAEHRPDVVLPPQPPRPSPAMAPATAPRAGANAHPTPAIARRGEPEVIVPVNQIEAVRRLVRAVNEGRIEAPPEPATGPMAAPAELEVVPIVIEPIPVPAIEPEEAGPSPEIRRSR